MMLAIVNDRFDLAAKLVELGADANDGSLYYADRDARRDDGLARARRLAAACRSPERAHGARPRQACCSRPARIPTSPSPVQLHNASMCCDPKANAHAVLSRGRRGRRRGAEAHAARTSPISRGSPKLDRRRGLRQPGRHTAARRALMVAMNGGKGVGMAGGPGDIREGTQPPFREVSNRDPARCRQVAARGRCGPEREDARRRLRAASRRLRRQARHRARARRRRRRHQAEGRRRQDGAAGRVGASSRGRRRPTAGAQVTREKPAQPAEVAALLRELASGNAQASNVGGSR